MNKDEGKENRKKVYNKGLEKFEVSAAKFSCPSADCFLSFISTV